MYLLISFEEVQKYQKMEGFNDHSVPCLDHNGSMFVDVEWLARKNGAKKVEILAKMVNDLLL